MAGKGLKNYEFGFWDGEFKVPELHPGKWIWQTEEYINLKIYEEACSWRRHLGIVLKSEDRMVYKEAKQMDPQMNGEEGTEVESG
jgi:hypothetical protein